MKYSFQEEKFNFDKQTDRHTDLLSHVAQEHHEEEEDMVKDKVKVSKFVKKNKIKLKRAIDVKKNANLKKIISCDLFDYNCKKSLTLKKHMAI